MDKYLLAIVIPAFKPDFLHDTLESLANQTDRNFCVYIGDDASPHRLDLIIDGFRSHLNIYYKRFTTNLGGISLVAHWNRCISLTSEPYLCLFSDDDIMSSDCVMNFYQSLAGTKSRFDLYRFNSAVIDSQGNLIAYHSLHPRIESNTDFMLNRLQFKRMSFISEYIFKRKAYERENGFVDFPLGWYSDDASWIVFSRLTGIYTIEQAIAYWRLSGKNISTTSNLTSYRKLKADILFARWIKSSINRKILEIQDHKKKIFSSSLQKWFFQQLNIIGIENINIFRNLIISLQMSPYLEMSSLQIFIRMLDFNKIFKLLKRISKDLL
jgi:glycosyltransferase involved in cell wall biosynthesis